MVAVRGGETGAESHRRGVGAADTEPRPPRPDTRFVDGTGTETRPSADDTPPVLPSGSQIGRYSVLSQLGSGGMGVVYKAWDPQLDRPVALKVLHKDWKPTGSNQRRRDTLLTEAQTLAKLSHPNIVTVYDAGLTENGMFLAMELSEGQDLHEWLEQGSRTTRQILDVFVGAGRGLAAAHAAGIVHRDFKPANVLIGEDGAIRVADFGLARLMGQGIVPSDEGTVPVDSAEIEMDRTASSIVGTPLFMAPEQLLGRVGDHRLDQFSFCLSLYFALIGTPAFPAHSFYELRRTVPRGLAEPERDRLQRARGVPTRVRRALLRGLAPNPQDRFGTMDELLDQLEERRRWPWVLAGTTLVLGLGVGTALGLEAGHPEACATPRAALEGVWDDADRQSVRQAFVATDHPASLESFGRTAARLDAYSEEWTEAYAGLCRDTFVTRQLSQRLFDARMRCLQGRRTRLRATIDTLLGAKDFPQLQTRMLAAFRLPAIDECREVQLPSNGSSLPTDPALLADVSQQHERLDVAATLRDASDYARGIMVATDVVQRARGLGHPPLVARALEVLGHLQVDGASAKDAETTLREAVRVASSSGDTGIEARAWAALLFSMVPQRKLDEGVHLGFAAAAAVDRAGDERAEAWFLNNLGILHAERGEFERGLEYLHRSLEIKQQLLGVDHVDVGIAWFNLGNLLVTHEKPAEAYDALQRATDAFATTVGEDHSFHQLALGTMCWVELEREHHARAYALCERAIEHFDRSPMSPGSMGMVYFRTAMALTGLRRVDEAWAMASRAKQLLQQDDPERAALVDPWMKFNAPRDDGASAPPREDGGARVPSVEPGSGSGSGSP